MRRDPGSGIPGTTLRRASLAMAVGAGVVGMGTLAFAGCAPAAPPATAARPAASAPAQALAWRTNAITVSDLFILVPRNEQERVSVLHCTVPTEGNVAGLYFTASNASDAPDHLVTASADAADMAMAHIGGVTFEVPASGHASLEVGGNHVMLMDLTRQLRPGNTVWVTLHFDVAGDVRALAVVRDLGAPAS